jgi:hypothetical protein
MVTELLLLTLLWMHLRVVTTASTFFLVTHEDIRLELVAGLKYVAGGILPSEGNGIVYKDGKVLALTWNFTAQEVWKIKSLDINTNY